MSQAIYRLAVLESAPGIKLRQQIAGPLNGARHQLRKKAHKGSKGNEVTRRFQLPLVHINGIAQSLEGVKTDTHRQDDV